jgi:hypothetical protein
MQNLLDVIGNDAADYELGFCSQPSTAFPQFNNKSGLTWYDWEQKTARPKLADLGYRVLRVYTGDGDSFGPLTRVFVVQKDGKEEKLIYG